MKRTTHYCLAVVLLAACSPHKVTSEPAAPLGVPSEFSKAGEAPLPDRWWQDFSDPALNGLVEATIAGNLQLAGAWARLRQAEAIAVQAGAGRYPQLDFSARASRTKVFNQFASQDPTGMTPKSFEVNSFNAQVAAGYELDVWRKMSNQTQAAIIDARGARGDVESIAMSLAAEVTEAWFDLRFQRAQRALLTEQIELNQSLLELVELRFAGGLSSALEVLQQRQQLIATRSRMVSVDATEALLRQRLAVLTGKPPQLETTSGEPVTLPELPPLPAAGVPGDLLVRRPDVRAARDRVIAADYRVAVAVADRLPSLRIGGNVSVQDTTIADLFKTPLWSIFASLAAPLFDGFRRKAEVERQRAVVSERLAGFGQVLLTAMAEVEGAIVGERSQLKLIAELEEQLTVANANLTEAQSRYEQGISPAGFLDVLGALQSKQAVELNLLSARRSLISQRVTLCRALGGTWTQSIKPSALLKPESARSTNGKPQ